MTEPYDPDHRDPRFHYGDREHMVRPGWFPATGFPVLEELREEHERLLAQRDARQAEVSALEDRFKEEDKEYQRALDTAARDGAEPDLPERTDEPERKRLREEAEARRVAATRALLAFGFDAVDRLRGELPSGWHAPDAVNSGRVPPNGEAAAIARELAESLDADRRRIEEARRVIEEADARMRSAVPLRVWLLRTANSGTPSSGPWLLAGGDLPIPPSHTPMTKPRDLAVKDWWPDADPNHGREEPVGADPALDTQAIPDDAEGGYVDESDPYFRTLESGIPKEM